MAVVTALVAQNTHGVRASHVPDVAFLRAQLDAVGDGVVVDAVKIGMVGTEAVAREIGAWLAAHRPPHVVLDPVMAATSGHRLLDPGAEDAVRSLLVHADLVVQRAAARRWAAGRAPGAGRWSRDYRLGIGRHVPRSAFDPRPGVDCVTLQVRRTGPVIRR